MIAQMKSATDLTFASSEEEPSVGVKHHNIRGFSLFVTGRVGELVERQSAHFSS